MARAIHIEYYRQDALALKYRQDCRSLCPLERLDCVQKLRVAFWGDAATTGRLPRVPHYPKRRIR
jgi:hypothetical protein